MNLQVSYEADDYTGSADAVRAHLAAEVIRLREERNRGLQQRNDECRMRQASEQAYGVLQAKVMKLEDRVAELQSRCIGLVWRLPEDTKCKEVQEARDMAVVVTEALRTIVNDPRADVDAFSRRIAREAVDKLVAWINTP